MVINRPQNGPINSSIAPRAPRVNCQNTFLFKWDHTPFLSNSDRDPYSENNNVSPVYT
jgi:hypothetical protein